MEKCCDNAYKTCNIFEENQKLNKAKEQLVHDNKVLRETVHILSKGKTRALDI